MSNVSNMPPPGSSSTPMFAPPPPYAAPVGPTISPYTNAYFQQPQGHPGQNFHIPPAAFIVSPGQCVQLPLRGLPTGIICPYCKADIITRVKYEPGLMTHVAAALICIIGCCCFVCVPYSAPSLQDASHECPECGKCVGFYRR